MKNSILFIGLVVFSLTACKKKSYKGTYNGTEALNVISPTDTLSSSFAQSVTIDFKGSKCNFESSTLIWEFNRKNKTATGYIEVVSDKYFKLEFKDDSLIAEFVTGGLEYTQRTFKGVKN